MSENDIQIRSVSWIKENFEAGDRLKRLMTPKNDARFGVLAIQADRLQIFFKAYLKFL